MFGSSPAMDWHPIQGGSRNTPVASCYRNFNECWPDRLHGTYADFTSTVWVAVWVLVQNVSHENHLIFMWMTIQVTHIFIPIVSHKDSFCHRGKSKLEIALFIRELLREPLIIVCWRLRYFVHNKSKTLFRMASDFRINIDYCHRVRTSIFLQIILWEFTQESEYEFSKTSRFSSMAKHKNFFNTKPKLKLIKSLDISKQRSTVLRGIQ